MHPFLSTDPKAVTFLRGLHGDFIVEDEVEPIECPGIERPELRLNPEHIQPTKGHNMSTTASDEVTLEELPQPKTFTPVKLTVTLNTAAEFADFYHRMNLSQTGLKRVADGMSFRVPDAPSNDQLSASGRVYSQLSKHAARLKLRG